MVCLLRVGLSDAADQTDEQFEGPDSDHFGPYILDRHEDGSVYELGRGAMGVTYRAIDTSLQRAVALKIIKTDVAGRSAEARERFIREARAAATLRHPHVATVYHFGIREETGQCFYAMELVEGETLDHRVRRTGPLDVATTVEIARQITAALAAAEKRGIVHRDLKPANAMIATTEGTEGVQDSPEIHVKVIDFGVAKALMEKTDPRVLTHGGLVGTPAFASPEQFTDSPVDVRSDIYSLGATLWYLLTAKIPFADRRQNEIPPTEQLNAANAPARFISLLVRMLSNEPSARPSVRELATRLQEIHLRILRRRKRFFAIAATLIFLLLAGAAVVFHVRSDISAAADPKSVAVLPFGNLTRDSSKAYFASGIQDDLLVNLSKVADLKVISRDSVLSYRDRAQDVREIGKALGVAAVLKGNVRYDGTRARINVQLINAKQGQQLWAEEYEREMTDAFTIQSELAFQIASALKAKLTSDETARLRRRPTENGEAYLLYMQAYDYYAGRQKLKADLEKAEQLFEKAIQLDPSFALAHAQLSRLESVWNSYYEPDPARRAKAQAAAHEALRLQPDLPEAHMALAEDYWRASIVMDDSDLESALREFEIARRGLPNDADIYSGIGRIKRHQGKWAESIANLQKAASLDPKTPDRWHRVFYSFELTRNYSAAAEALDRAIALSPNTWDFELHRGYLNLFWKGDVNTLKRLRAATGTTPEDLHTEDRFAVKRFLRKYDEAENILRQDKQDTFFWNGVRDVPKSFLLGELYFEKGDKEKSRTAFAAALPTVEKVVQQNPQDLGWRLLAAKAYAGMGRKEEAIREGKHAIEIMPESKSAWFGATTLESFAEVYAILGDAEHAVPILTHLLAIPSDAHKEALRLDPVWDPIRQDTRFRQLLRQPASIFPLRPGDLTTR